ncbi:MAG: hypothetical protein SAK29_35190 [Scytonema sp. PMC 1069.18]|nr:hypothetical protein [Scytonema sp. PMC 1069.18]MEC4881123.1 hypothetical protein [Scytonema sp. PMC 1070.18]
MKSQFKEIFQKTTFGFKEETGHWQIDIGVADDQSVASLNNYVIELVKIFLLAFQKLCRPVEVYYDTMTVNANGKTEQVEEGQVRLVEGKSHAQLLQELKLSLKNPEKSFFTTIFIDCDLYVFVINPEDTLNEDITNQVWIPRVARFYFGFVMEPLEDEEAYSCRWLINSKVIEPI